MLLSSVSDDWPDGARHDSMLVVSQILSVISTRYRVVGRRPMSISPAVDDFVAARARCKRQKPLFFAGSKAAHLVQKQVAEFRAVLSAVSP
jgi:hypothetical protein